EGRAVFGDRSHDAVHGGFLEAGDELGHDRHDDHQQDEIDGLLQPPVEQPAGGVEKQ
ncbi:unnamed protein product, partial [Arabidopsis halleri]